jgi:hypothetical protein
MIRGSTGPSRAELLGRPGTIAACAEAGGSPSSEAPLDHAVQQGRPMVDRVARVEAAITGESGWGGDSRIERSRGCA